MPEVKSDVKVKCLINSADRQQRFQVMDNKS